MTGKMDSRGLIVALSILTLQILESRACPGCVNLDESSFAKIRPKFDALLVKFDVAFPYGDKHEIFTKFAAEVAANHQILLGEVGVKDYGEKDNEEFARRMGVSKDQFPALKLFGKNPEPATFPDDLEFTVSNLRDFVRDNTEIYLGLPGCVEQLDKIARRFVAGPDKRVLEEAVLLEKELEEKDRDSAKIYLVVMRKILENGAQFIAQERERVSKLLKGKISAKKHGELNSRLNILRAFTAPSKDEL